MHRAWPGSSLHPWHSPSTRSADWPCGTACRPTIALAHGQTPQRRAWPCWRSGRRPERTGSARQSVSCRPWTVRPARLILRPPIRPLWPPLRKGRAAHHRRTEACWPVQPRRHTCPAPLGEACRADRQRARRLCAVCPARWSLLLCLCGGKCHPPAGTQGRRQRAGWVWSTQGDLRSSTAPAPQVADGLLLQPPVRCGVQLERPMVEATDKTTTGRARKRHGRSTDMQAGQASGLDALWRLSEGTAACTGSETARASCTTVSVD